MFRRVLLLPSAVLLALCVASAAPAVAGCFVGLQSLEVSAVNSDGSPDVQAGSHPFQLKVSFLLAKPDEFTIPGRSEPDFRPAGGGVKDFRLELPPGLIGNPSATPKCAYTAFAKRECPNDTAVGEATTKISLKEGYKIGETNEYLPQTNTITNPVYNVEAPEGIPAELGFLVKGVTPVFVDASVRTGGDYGVTVTASNIPQAAAAYGSTVKIWGVPADPSHDLIRGSCLGEAESNGEEEELFGIEHNEEESRCEPPGAPGALPVEPFLTNPTSCGVPRVAVASVDFWEEPGVFTSKPATLPEVSGCEKLDFGPTISLLPHGTAGSTPTGLNVDLRIPQESTMDPAGLGEADMKSVTVALPTGMQVSPSAADGLQACSIEQIGYLPEISAPGALRFTPERPSCPDASKVATARISTPLLEHELEGAVYLAAPQNFSGSPPQNPFGSLVALYLVAEEPATGVLVKLAGEVSLNPADGQVTATFENIPQFPVGSASVNFFGTERTPLATPPLCGTYSNDVSILPWSGTAAVDPSSSFQITSGPGGAPCSAALGFAPSLIGGSTNIQAGGFSPLKTTITREDGQQDIQTVQLHFPAGLSGVLRGVQLCPEAQANAGTCGPESLIGETIVSVGLGKDPFTVTGGKVYLTEKYEGAPFGLSIVNPAKAGPFELQEGQPVVVRGKLELDPHTTALTFTSNTEAEGHAIPSIIAGIPLQIKHVNVTIDRTGFTFNPTDCRKMQITGSIGSAQGASSPVSVPFQVANCTKLGFAPKFDVSTSAKTSRTEGASLNVKLVYPSAPFGSQANISEVMVKLPKQLPARLTTLQKACTAAQFEANPAGCPAASIVGHAKAVTPLLPVPLEGPAYFVSYGGEAYPDLIMVLQGYGITVDLVGTTFISKQKVTSSTFKTVPDQPVSAFELNLPEGKYSALTTDGKLCGAKLALPTMFAAQNGVEIQQSTKVNVTGCPKTKLHRKTKTTKKKKRKKKK